MGQNNGQDKIAARGTWPGSTGCHSPQSKNALSRFDAGSH